MALFSVTALAEINVSLLTQVCDHFQGVTLSKSAGLYAGLTLSAACRKEVEAGKGMNGVFTLLIMRWPADCIASAAGDKGNMASCENWKHEALGYLDAVRDFEKGSLSCASLGNDKSQKRAQKLQEKSGASRP